MNLNRRQFLKTSALTAAAAALPGAPPPLAAAQTPGSGRPGTADGNRLRLIDTNVHLFEWPFRHLKYGKTPALVAKLRKHNVQQAWAGSFEALYSKDLGGANARLVEECRRYGDGLLVPIGSVNPLWSGWEEELRRCVEVHRMRAIRLHPCHQGYSLEEPEFARLLAKATERRLLVQIVVELEDPRVHHAQIIAPSTSAAPLVSLLPQVPGARVQLVGDGFGWMRIPQAKPLLEAKNLWHEISAVEGVGGVGRLMEGKHWNIPGRIPLERLTFGSHAPYFPLESALLKLFESPLTMAQLQAIMETNARQLLAQT
jgi:uncharacterized protein